MAAGKVENEEMMNYGQNGQAGFSQVQNSVQNQIQDCIQNNSQNKIQSYIQEYTQNYMEKVFYFCLRKTGNRTEAEDLASDISLNILQTLNNGAVPRNVSAWVWQIARNRYSVWAARKHSYMEADTGTDINDYEIEDGKAGVEELLVNSENLALLRRELAFIASDYRNILVAYYIEDRKTCDIAVSFGLPKGTVESKLFRARKMLKEGMDMAREFGQRSYRPEEFEFVTAGEQPYGIPGNLLAWSMMQNILLEANQNPSTMEELSMELGVALPYMEEAVEALEEVSLLAKEGNRYVTNFFIADRECQMQMHRLLGGNRKTRAEWINRLVSDSVSGIRALGVQPCGGDDNLLKWWVTLYVLDFLISQVKGYEAAWPERPLGGNWGVVAYEKAALPEKDVPVSHMMVKAQGPVTYSRYRIPELMIGETQGAPKQPEDMMTCEELAFLAEVLGRNRKAESFGESERNLWERIKGRFAWTENDGSIVSKVFVIRKSGLVRIHEMITEHLLYEKMSGDIQQVFDGLVQMIKKRTSGVLREDLARYASMEIFQLRAMLIQDLKESGKLEMPRESERNLAGTCIWLPD